MPIADGRFWYGHRVEKKPVVYIALEGEAGVKIRAEAWVKHNQRPLPSDLRIVLQPFKLTDPKDLADLVVAIQSAVGAGSVIVLDTLNRAAPTSDENSSKDLGEILEAAKKLQNQVGGLVVLVHHTGKDVTRGMRGHSSMPAAIDASIEVSRDGDIRTWMVAKAKDGQDGTSHPFKLEVISLGCDEYGDLITSCVCVPIAPDESIRQRPLTHRQEEGLAALIRAVVAHGEEVEEGCSQRVQLEFWREEFYRTCSADGQDAKRAAFTRVRKDLIERQRVTVLDDYYYVDSNEPGLIALRITERTVLSGSRTDVGDTHDCAHSVA